MNRLFLLLLFFTLFLSGCQYYNYTYIQTPVSVPDLKETGDLKIQGSVNPKGVNAEIAYSPIQHLGVLATATSAFGKDAKCADLGLGYYLNKKDYLFSVYGGVGFGNLVNQGESKEWLSEDTKAWDNRSAYNKLYLQASLGKDFFKICRFSFSVRASFVTFNSYQYRFHSHDAKYELSYVQVHDEFDTLQISSNASALIIDPTITATFFQHKRISFTAQLGLAFLKRYGEFQKANSIDLSTYQPSISSGHPSTVSQSTASYQLRLFPITFNIGARINISARKK